MTLTRIHQPREWSILASLAFLSLAILVVVAAFYSGRETVDRTPRAINDCMAQLERLGETGTIRMVVGTRDGSRVIGKCEVWR